VERISAGAVRAHQRHDAGQPAATDVGSLGISLRWCRPALSTDAANTIGGMFLAALVSLR